MKGLNRAPSNEYEYVQNNHQTKENKKMIKNLRWNYGYQE